MSNTGIRLFQVDAFASEVFSGNPAAVAFVPENADDELFRSIANEMNLSETAFPVRRRDGSWDLRWFTPATEVDLCGHATLATAHVLFENNIVAEHEVVFHTRSGELRCSRRQAEISMEFPSSPPSPVKELPGRSADLG